MSSYPAPAGYHLQQTEYDQQQPQQHSQQVSSNEFFQSELMGFLLQPNIGGGTDINVILDQILTVSSLSLEDSKNADIHNHRMKNALFAVLCEIKEKTAMNYRNLEMEDPPDPQLMRLDNMLVAEGVVGMGEQGAGRAMTTDNTTISHPDYKTKLAQIRTIYSEEMEKYQQGCEVSEKKLSESEVEIII